MSALSAAPPSLKFTNVENNDTMVFTPLASMSLREAAAGVFEAAFMTIRTGVERLFAFTTTCHGMIYPPEGIIDEFI